MRFVLAFAYFDLYHDTTVHWAGVSVRICLAIIEKISLYRIVARL
jgi:hypothetical protein